MGGGFPMHLAGRICRLSSLRVYLNELSWSFALRIRPGDDTSHLGGWLHVPVACAGWRGECLLARNQRCPPAWRNQRNRGPLAAGCPFWL